MIPHDKHSSNVKFSLFLSSGCKQTCTRGSSLEPKSRERNLVWTKVFNLFHSCNLTTLLFLRKCFCCCKMAATTRRQACGRQRGPGAAAVMWRQPPPRCRRKNTNHLARTLVMRMVPMFSQPQPMSQPVTSTACRCS